MITMSSSSRTVVAGFLAPLLLVAALVATEAGGLLQLPDTSAIDGQLTANLGVDHFFSLWIVFNNDNNIKMSGEPFTILAPQNTATKRAEKLLQQPELLKKLLLDHVLLGERVDLSLNGTTTANKDVVSSFRTLGGRTVHVRRSTKDGGGGGGGGGNDGGDDKLKVNEAGVVERKTVGSNGLLVVLDDFLFPIGVSEQQPTAPDGGGGEQGQQRQSSNVVEKKNTTVLTAQGTQGGGAAGGTSPAITAKGSDKGVEGGGGGSPNNKNTTFVENVMEVLSFLKSGVRVFQHFLSRSNVSKLLSEDTEYTVFVPTDHAFQRWHPIDWGFYPFSVPEFTESIIINHFVKGRLKQDALKDGQVVQTLGGREISFKKTPYLSINGALVVKGDTPVSKGNIMFISEVLFVSESVVSKLHQQHRDKETPPLLAFPWFGAQFLSHAFLALERDKRFAHITRFLNLADLAPHVSGTGYTFFVPTDTAFEELGLDKMPDNYLSTGDGLRILLNHFVKGRLYDKDLKDGTELNTLGNKTITVKRTKDKVKINDATIVESEVFVYNLGTMFYIDKVLFTSTGNLPPTTSTEPAVTTDGGSASSFTTAAGSESVPEELAEKSGSLPDVLFSDAAEAPTNETHSTEVATTAATSVQNVTISIK